MNLYIFCIAGLKIQQNVTRILWIDSPVWFGELIYAVMYNVYAFDDTYLWQAQQ